MCEKCWSDAYLRSTWSRKSQYECYCELLEQRKDNPCSPEEQESTEDTGEVKCPECGSEKTTWHGNQKWSCRACGHRWIRKDNSPPKEQDDEGAKLRAYARNSNTFESGWDAALKYKASKGESDADKRT